MLLSSGPRWFKCCKGYYYLSSRVVGSGQDDDVPTHRSLVWLLQRCRVSQRRWDAASVRDHPRSHADAFRQGNAERRYDITCWRTAAKHAIISYLIIIMIFNFYFCNGTLSFVSHNEGLANKCLFTLFMIWRQGGFRRRYRIGLMQHNGLNILELYL